MALSDLRGVLTGDAHEALTDEEKELYTERDGSFELTGIKGVKSEADVRRLQSSLEKERGDHKSTRTKLGLWGDLKHEEVMGRLDRIPELEAAAEPIDDEKLQEMAEARALTRLKPLERENLRLQGVVDERDAAILEYSGKETRRVVGDALRAAGAQSKMINPDDAVIFGRPHFGVNEAGEVATAEGLTPEQFLTDLMPKAGHLWGPSVGGGAGGASGGGAGGPNPFSKKGWNMTEQGRLLKEKGAEHVKRLAEAAGTTVGGLRPKD